jgi:hypothetical protein
LQVCYRSTLLIRLRQCAARPAGKGLEEVERAL